MFKLTEQEWFWVFMAVVGCSAAGAVILLGIYNISWAQEFWHSHNAIALSGVLLGAVAVWIMLYHFPLISLLLAIAALAGGYFL
jgi:hypothetical protein